MGNDRLIDFERADVITPMIYPPRPRLTVTGVKPGTDVEVTLVPLVYVSQPSYQGIQVVATTNADRPHVSQPIANVPYVAELDLAGICGSEGIEVIGETRTERITVEWGTLEPDPEAADA